MDRSALTADVPPSSIRSGRPMVSVAASRTSPRGVMSYEVLIGAGVTANLGAQQVVTTDQASGGFSPPTGHQLSEPAIKGRLRPTTFKQLLPLRHAVPQRSGASLNVDRPSRPF